MKPKMISAEEFDRMFDDGEDISGYIDFSSVRRPGLEAKRVNVDFPGEIVSKLDRAAKRRGVSRQALIKMWIVQQLDNEAKLDTAA
ncbi:type II toxin-antitoxin system BrnA family antitoxin [Blastomonas sp.]|uniref:type II toxin-antitoxin system BrnA family antitoxin n=1 Tax=Blastomonas sp. TaxID=1909299 RepID=UPI00391D6042